MGLLDAILGAANPVSQFVDSHSNTLAAIGPALSSSNWSGVAAGKQQDYQNTLQQNALQLAVQQRNATAQWLTQIGRPDLAAAAQSGAMTFGDAFNAVTKPTVLNADQVAVNPLTNAITDPSAGANAAGGIPGSPSPVGKNIGDPYQGTVNGQNVMLSNTEAGGPRLLGAVSGSQPVGGAPVSSPPGSVTPVPGSAPPAGPTGIIAPNAQAALTTGADVAAKMQAAQPGMKSLLDEQQGISANLLGDPSANGGWAQYQPGNTAEGLISKAYREAGVPGAAGGLQATPFARVYPPAANLGADVQAIESSGALDKLQQFRDIAAQSGGGSSMRFTNTDVNLLAKSGASLDPTQSGTNLQQNLQRYGAQLRDLNRNMTASYSRMFPNGVAPNPAAPAPLAPQQPTTPQAQPAIVQTRVLPGKGTFVQTADGAWHAAQ